MKRLIVLVMLTLAVAAATVVFNPLALLPAAEVEPGSPPRETAEVAVRDLQSTFEAEDGNIVFAVERPVNDGQSGTVGWITDPERELEAGDVLYERDGQPVAYLVGDVPAWRTMRADDVGADVAQLETNLLAMGYGDASEFTVDDTFTTATATIVERWQADLGVAETGSVSLGDVVFGPAGARVGSVAAAVGDQTLNATLLVLSSAEREMVFTVAAETLGFISPGTVVRGELPDRSTVEATVVEINPAGDGLSLISAAISSAEGAVLPLGDAIPVSVSWSQVQSAEATTVPASSIIRLDSGHYAVEVVDEPGGTELVVVEVGDRFGTNVEILDGIEPGVTVIAP